MLRTWFVGVTLAATLLGQAQSPIVDRVGPTAFIQTESPSFMKLSPQQKELAYWLTQAAIAIDPIIFDQLSRFGLRQKAVLEAVVGNRAKIDPAVYAKVLEYTKLFWANKGNHNENTSQKFLPSFSPESLNTALRAAGRADLLVTASELNQSFFDPEFEPVMIAKSPKPGQDLLAASANNFYFGVTMPDLKNFTEHYALNSRLVKENGKLAEQIYRAGTPDGKIPPGVYAQYLKKANTYLARAQKVAEPAQSKVIGDLVRFYQTGEHKDWIQFGSDWVRASGAVDFASGFIEVYRDARGAKGSSQSFVSITDEELSAAMHKIAANAQYFEDRAPWTGAYKKQGVTPPIANAVEMVVETGDFHVTTIGDSLPNEAEIRESIGSKSFIISSSTKALDLARGSSINVEFSATPEVAELQRKYAPRAQALLVAMHEVIGHGSGKLGAKVGNNPAAYLKEYFSTLEEARADLMAYWNVYDPKLKELDLVQNEDLARAMYNSAANNMLVQLRGIRKGDTIEEDHARGRQLIAAWIMDNTGAIAWEKRDGKTYVVVNDYQKMHEGVGQLLAELMRIKAEGDYDAIRKLIDKYGVHFDPKLRDEVVARYDKLNVPIYWAGISPELTAQFGANGMVTGVSISYPRDFVKQRLSWNVMQTEPSKN